VTHAHHWPAATRAAVTATAFTALVAAVKAPLVASLGGGGGSDNAGSSGCSGWFALRSAVAVGPLVEVLPQRCERGLLAARAHFGAREARGGVCGELR
jgi:hypothetical protein